MGYGRISGVSQRRVYSRRLVSVVQLLLLLLLLLGDGGGISKVADKLVRGGGGGESGSESGNESGDGGSESGAAQDTTDSSSRQLQQATVGSITRFDLINAVTEKKINSLSNGQVIVVSSIPGLTTTSPNFNIDAKTSGTVQSVVFALNNVTVQTESAAPWAFCGNNGADFFSCPTLNGGGTVTVSATPYSAKSGSGTKGTTVSVTFTIVLDTAAPTGKSPTKSPTKSPVVAAVPTKAPTKSPVAAAVPTKSPTKAPVAAAVPTKSPTKSPVAAAVPTKSPTKSPVAAAVPTKSPTKSPVAAAVPTKSPTKSPVAAAVPTKSPVVVEAPTKSPVAAAVPTKSPVVVEAPTKSPVAVAVAPTQSPVAATVVSPVLINCGSTSSYTDSLNRIWLADVYFDAVSGVYSTGNAIANTVEDTLYRTERTGVTISYSIPRPPGTYAVTLHLAEI
jgi:Malectin domain